jgi:hypothetical protein
MDSRLPSTDGYRSGLMIVDRFILYIVGTPVEVYTYGTQYWMIWIGYLTMIFLATHIFVPVFYRLRLTSVFEVHQAYYNVTLLFSHAHHYFNSTLFENNTN